MMMTSLRAALECDIAVVDQVRKASTTGISKECVGWKDRPSMFRANKAHSLGVIIPC